MKFDTDKLSDAIKADCPQVVFALLHGSAKHGSLKKNSDVDIAVYLDTKPSLQIYQDIIESAEKIIPGAKIDVGVLNNAEPVYKFEALKGKLLFARDKEKYLGFFSLTCREYEYQMADYQRQQKYRRQFQKQNR